MDKKQLLTYFAISFVAAFLAIWLYTALNQASRTMMYPGGFMPPPTPREIKFSIPKPPKINEPKETMPGMPQESQKSFKSQGNPIPVNTSVKK